MKKIIYIYDTNINNVNFNSSFYNYNKDKFLTNLSNTNIFNKDDKDDKYFKIDKLNFIEFEQIYNNLKINDIEEHYDYIMFDNIYVFIKYINLFKIIDNFSINNNTENINHVLTNINNKKYIMFFNYETNNDDLLPIFLCINNIFNYIIIFNEYTYNFLYDIVKNTNNLNNFNFSNIFYIPYQIDISILNSSDMENISNLLKNTNIIDVLKFNNSYTNPDNINLLYHIFNNKFISSKISKFICKERFDNICILTNNNLKKDIYNISKLIEDKLKYTKQICSFCIDNKIDYNYLFTNLDSFDALFLDSNIKFDDNNVKNKYILNNIIYYANINGKLIFSNIDYNNNTIININKISNNDFSYMKLKLFLNSLILFYVYNVNNLSYNFNNFIEKNESLNLINTFINSINLDICNADKLEEIVNINLNNINNNNYFNINYINTLFNILNLYKSKYNKYDILSNNIKYILNNICNYDINDNVVNDNVVNDNVVNDNVLNDTAVDHIVVDDKITKLINKLRNNKLNNNNLNELLNFIDICNKIFNINKCLYSDDIKYVYSEFKKYLIKISKLHNKTDVFNYLIHMLLMNNEYNLIKSLINNQDFKKYNTLFLNSILPYFYRSNDNLNSENLFKKY